MSDERITITEYAIQMAEVAAKRSEDPFCKVGAVALTTENRIIATAYNGLLPGFDPHKDMFLDRETRLPYMLHAEQNLCSLFKRGEVWMVAITISPCPSCLMLLAAHGVGHICFREWYHRDLEMVKRISERYNIPMIHAPKEKI